MTPPAPHACRVVIDGGDRGAHWRVIDMSAEYAILDMRTCTEDPMERVESRDPR